MTMSSTAPTKWTNPTAQLLYYLTLRGALVLVVVVNLLLAGLLFGLQPVSQSARPVNAAPPPLPAAVETLLARRAAGGAGESYSLTLSDADLTALAGRALSERSDVPFTRVRVASHPSRLSADALATGLAFPLPVRVSSILMPENGQPRLFVTDVTVSGMPLPSFARQQLMGEAKAGLDLSRYELPLTVEGRELRDGALTLTGRLR
jgi:hypothetical protein